MCPGEIEEARQSFIAERLAIMEFDGGMSPDDGGLMKYAQELWEQYWRDIKGNIK